MTGRYTVTYAPRARRDSRRLPEKITTACVEFISAVLADNPYRVGKPLTSSREDKYSARRADWRIIHRRCAERPGSYIFALSPTRMTEIDST